MLADREPLAAIRLLSNLTAGLLDLTPSELHGLSIRTQVTTDSGRPDIEIRAAGRLVFVEVKEEADVGDTQLARYRADLNRSNSVATCLVLLTRYRPALLERETLHVRWHQIGYWLENELAAVEWNCTATKFLVGEFVEFLRARGLAMSKVEAGMFQGVHSLDSLFLLLSEAAERCSHEVEREWEWKHKWMGVYLEGRRFSVGVTLDGPDIVTFETCKFGIDAEAAKSLPFGQVVESKWPRWTRGPFRWRRTLNLAGVDSDFYLSDVSFQLHSLESFVLESLQAAKSVGRTEPPESDRLKSDQGLRDDT